MGTYLVSHPGVDMVAFTGSTATGAKILQSASATLKPAVLEVRVLLSAFECFWLLLAASEYF